VCHIREIELPLMGHDGRAVRPSWNTKGACGPPRVTEGNARRKGAIGTREYRLM
jgi:hypothetical protein